MSNIPVVRKVDSAEGDDIEQDQPAAQESGYFVTYVADDALDQARFAARDAFYPNSEVERRTIAAVDEEVFDRVRPLEQMVTAQAESHVARGKSSVEGAFALRQELEAVRDDLRRGKDIVELTRRYTQLRREVERTRSLQQSYGKSAESLAAKVADPFAATQRALSIMPRSSFNPIDTAPRWQ
ncbi:hypothetical protein SAMN05216282_11145 [Cryobacterium psychrotolerans]|uniref:Uncharacterized protein n=1 Tax=Cryobacterium psychrotolerans TaxID=386301 RepID=A0A1G9E684_9MICO|nr:hypothetical protein [Cryobacterium psychrotolerans]TFD86407.1 hypothetical protein E3T56_07435 [Cryobacterium psychrotolerans]SDK71652.1 hypothetical protein SAMN05216282_11145 [Cryobacterium psychrotolerans]